MLKIIFKIIKRIIISCFLLYGYNLIAGPLDLMIPINLVTVLSISIFGLPALIAFIVIYVLVY